MAITKERVDEIAKMTVTEVQQNSVPAAELTEAIEHMIDRHPLTKKSTDSWRSTSESRAAVRRDLAMEYHGSQYAYASRLRGR